MCVIPQLQRRKADLDLSLPPPLDSVVLWLQRAEAVLTGEGGGGKDHADAAKEARFQQDTLKVIFNLTLQNKSTIEMKHFQDNSEAAYMLWDENVASYFLYF